MCCHPSTASQASCSSAGSLVLVFALYAPSFLFPMNLCMVTKGGRRENRCRSDLSKLLWGAEDVLFLLLGSMFFIVKTPWPSCVDQLDVRAHIDSSSIFLLLASRRHRQRQLLHHSEREAAGRDGTALHCLSPATSLQTSLQHVHGSHYNFIIFNQSLTGI